MIISGTSPYVVGWADSPTEIDEVIENYIAQFLKYQECKTNLIYYQNILPKGDYHAKVWYSFNEGRDVYVSSENRAQKLREITKLCLEEYAELLRVFTSVSSTMNAHKDHLEAVYPVVVSKLLEYNLDIKNIDALQTFFQPKDPI